MIASDGEREKRGREGERRSEESPSLPLSFVFRPLPRCLYRSQSALRLSSLLPLSLSPSLSLSLLIRGIAQGDCRVPLSFSFSLSLSCNSISHLTHTHTHTVAPLGLPTALLVVSQCARELVSTTHTNTHTLSSPFSFSQSFFPIQANVHHCRIRSSHFRLEALPRVAHDTGRQRGGRERSSKRADRRTSNSLPLVAERNSSVSLSRSAIADREIERGERGREREGEA